MNDTKQAVLEIELANDCIFQAAKRVRRESKAFEALRDASYNLLVARKELNDEIRKEVK